MTIDRALLALLCASAAVLLAPWLTQLVDRAVSKRSGAATPNWTQVAVAPATAIGFGATALHFGPRPELLAYLFLVAVLVVLSFVDLATKTLPRQLVYVALVGGIALLAPIGALSGQPQRVVWATLGALGAFVVLTVLHVAARGGFGFGDVRLGAMLGWYLAWQGPRFVPVGLFLAFVLSAVVGLALMAFGRAGRRTAIPFGPFLAVGAVLALMTGPLATGA